MTQKDIEKDFINTGYQILEKDNELLLFIRYPFCAGSRDFLLVKTKEELNCLLEKSSTGDSIAIIHNFVEITKGIVDDMLIQNIILEFEKINDYVSSYSWLIINEQELSKFNRHNLIWVSDKEDLIESLEELRATEIRIIVEPDGVDEKSTTHVYKDGFVGTY